MTLISSNLLHKKLPKSGNFGQNKSKMGQKQVRKRCTELSSKDCTKSWAINSAEWLSK